MIRFARWVTLSLAAVLPAAALAQALTPQQIAQQAKRASVQIRALDSRGTVTGSGSGFFISRDGLIVSNFHVVEEAASLQVERDTGEVFDNVFFVTADPRRDTVILKIPVSNVAPLVLGSDEQVDIGSRIYVMGNPLGQTATFSDGLVSAKRVLNGVQLLQVTAPISPGSSGGPAMDERGQVIGIATMFLEGGQNLNFLVPVQYVRPMVAMGETPQRFSAAVLPRGVRTPAQAASSSSIARTEAAPGGPDEPMNPETERMVQSLAAQVKSSEAYLRANGYVPSHELTSGALNTHERESTRAELDAGTPYAAFVVCDDDCRDVDLDLYDPSGRKIASDVESDDFAFVMHRPLRSGVFVFNVAIAHCSREPCGYVLWVFEQAK